MDGLSLHIFVPDSLAVSRVPALRLCVHAAVTTLAGHAGLCCASSGPGRRASLVEGGVGSGSSAASGSALVSCAPREGAQCRPREAGPLLLHAPTPPLTLKPRVV